VIATSDSVTAVTDTGFVQGQAPFEAFVRVSGEWRLMKIIGVAENGSVVMLDLGECVRCVCVFLFGYPNTHQCVCSSCKTASYLC
jgi:hypothetical protein